MALTLPSPRTPDPAQAPPLRWGVLGPGGIARSFTSALHEHTASRVTAVGSRDRARAQRFADELGVATAHDGYAELVADPDVDIVYVATPHSEHRDHALLALEAGKPVLVEKAFARNAAEARQVVDAARDKGLFAMEAMWTRHLPHIDIVRQCLEQGLLGEVRLVLADHGQQLYPGGPARLSQPELAGGALLDLGIYPVSFASMTIGPFASVTAAGTLAATGVDASISIAVTARSGAVASLATTMLARTPTTASVSGTDARLEVEGTFYAPTSVHLILASGDRADSWTVPRRVAGLHYEAAEAARRITAGETESPLMPLEESVAIMTALDEVRRQLGVVFPGE